ncbi:MAG: radical SAM family heme chaperone HemW [Lachnospiraceae bacterium]|nr:radical SAM family heme chaperone HemW [Lachnospiraceae bacterium]
MKSSISDKNGDIAVYVHIPFCVRKCLYCDFNSFPASGDVYERYTEAILKEIEKNRSVIEDRQIVSVYFGGGTPSLMDPGSIADILGRLNGISYISDEAEITMEMNPGTVTKEKIIGYKSAGVNRASIGLQSASDKELKALGRIHVFEDFLRSYDLIRENGISNVSVDLMTGIPYQTIDSLMRSIDTVTSLLPEHISAYSLIIEEGTPFAKKSAGELHIPDEDETYRLYKLTRSALKSKGYERYEISNYAKITPDGTDYRCHHNLRYWERKDYIGFGISAASLIGNRRYTNTSDLLTYINDPGASLEEELILDTKEAMEEFMYLGLREIGGVSEAEFLRVFNRSIRDIYADVIKDHIKNGLMTYSDGRLKLTDKGIDISNRVLSDYLL